MVLYLIANTKNQYSSPNINTNITIVAGIIESQQVDSQTKLAMDTVEVWP
jgi:hypothetical protein